MSKFKLRIKARDLRQSGVSIIKIAEILKVSKSTVSTWVKDIILSIEQLEDLRNSSLKGAELGRLKSALIQKKKWLERKENARVIGKKIIDKLNRRELLLVGIALYWAEGSKKKRTIEFCNSDPLMIKLFLRWLKICFNIKTKELRCRIGINEIHKERENVVKKYWIEITKIPINQFTKTSFKKVQSKKIYDNIEAHYGTLSIIVTKPSRFYLDILGLIDGLAIASFKMRQRSSVAEQSFHKRPVTGSNPVVGTK